MKKIIEGKLKVNPSDINKLLFTSIQNIPDRHRRGEYAVINVTYRSYSKTYHLIHGWHIWNIPIDFNKSYEARIRDGKICIVMQKVC